MGLLLLMSQLFEERVLQGLHWGRVSFASVWDEIDTGVFGLLGNKGEGVGVLFVSLSLDIIKLVV